MIIDHIDNAALYWGLGPRFEQALRYLAETDLAATAPQRYDLDGDDLFALIQQYQAKPRAEGFWEAHRRYADVQYVVSGAEHMGYAPIAALKAGEYDGEKDFLKLEGQGAFIELRAGFFMILCPQDGHMPGLAIEAPTPVKKAVVKVKL